MTNTIFDDFLKTMIEFRPDMTALIKSQQASNLRTLKISRNSIDMSKVHEQLKEIFATSVTFTKISQIHSDKRSPDCQHQR
jgi:hypothetical protein